MGILPGGTSHHFPDGRVVSAGVVTPTAYGAQPARKRAGAGRCPGFIRTGRVSGSGHSLAAGRVHRRADHPHHLTAVGGLDAYGTLLFWVHMVQHLLLLMVVPPLLWLGDPFIYSLWGMPRPLRLRMSGLFADPSPFRHVLQKVTSAGPAWLYIIAATWIWHDGKVYDLALRSEVVHDLEHLTFFVAGMIFFWHVVGSASDIHHTMSYIQRVAYVVSEVPANMFLGRLHRLRFAAPFRLLHHCATGVGHLRDG